MIQPNPPLDTSANNLQGYTLVTLLYEPELNYAFVLNSSQTQGQIWEFSPVAMSNALGISTDQVKILYLKPYAPVTANPNDLSSILTLNLMYIPSQYVETLAGLLQSTSSKYYTASSGVAGQLANFTTPAFPVLYTTDPNVASTDGGPANNDAASSITAASARRKDAIIGVCSAIGGIAVLVLAWWLIKTYQRKRESQHHRLSAASNDPLGYGRGGFVGYGATEDGMRERREAPPSVGPDGVRRNSFYFAEDSLRGYVDPQRDAQENVGLAGPSGSGQQGQAAKRQVGGARISPPILRDNTLNW